MPRADLFTSIHKEPRAVTRGHGRRPHRVDFCAAACGGMPAAAVVLLTCLSLAAVLVACGGGPAAVDSPSATASFSPPPIASPASSPASGATAAADLRRLFAYDDAEPLGLTVTGTRTVDGVALRDVAYRGSGAGATGILSVPAGRGPFPAVLYAPGVGCPASMFEIDMAALQRAGIAALAVDPPDRRAPFAEPVSLDPKTVAAAHVQYVGDLRRGFDVLASLPGVDPDRLGYVGYSWGGYVGGFLAGLRAPAVVYVLTYAGADWVGADPARVAGFVDPAVAVGLSRGASFLFQAGIGDPLFSRSSVRRYYESAPSAKALQWFPGGHGDLWAQPSGPAVESHRTWLKKRLRPRSGVSRPVTTTCRCRCTMPVRRRTRARRTKARRSVTPRFAGPSRGGISASQRATGAPGRAYPGGSWRSACPAAVEKPATGLPTALAG